MENLDMCLKTYILKNGKGNDEKTKSVINIPKEVNSLNV